VVSVKRLKTLLSIFQKVAGLHVELLDDEQVRIFAGLPKSSLQEVARLSGVPMERVFRFYVYCRLGVGQRVVGVVGDISQSTLSGQFKEDVPKIMAAMRDKYLRRSRSDFLKGRPAIVLELLPALVAAVDGTYHKCEKSSDFAVQLKSWNTQKKHNLIKSLSLMTADGRWWDVLGLFFSDGSHNDEMMWEYAWKENLQDFKSVIEPDVDLFVVDRFVF
jgi:hypothetical protein